MTSPASEHPSVPSLIVNPPGRGIRTLGRLSRNIRAVADQIEPYTNWWSEQNQRAIAGTGPMWFVIGDSTALGIGASEPAKGYVGLAAEALGVRVINLAMSGARVRDGLDRQLPIVNDLISSDVTPAFISMCLGSNDVFWRSGNRSDGVLRAELDEAIEHLPVAPTWRTVVTPVAGVSERAKLANRAIRRAAARRDLPVVDFWDRGDESPRERIASDRFHPNGLGYRRMAEAMVSVLGSSL